MKNSRFWLKLTVYLLPFALPVILFSGLLMYTGESMPLSTVVQLQQGEEPVLYRPQYGNRDLWYKSLSIQARQPEVIALGSSRVLQFRAGMFTENPDAFYNAGAPAWKLEQVTGLLYGLPADALPEIIVLGIDPPWFNDAYVGDTFTRQPTDFEQVFAVNRSVMQDIISGKRAYDWGELLQRREPAGGGLALGFRAIADGHGFRNDGSEQYGDFLVARWLDQATERERHMGWMRQGEDMYVYGDTVSESAMKDMRGLLDWARENRITIIGFMPTYTPQLWERMMRRGNHTYIEALIPQLDALFAEYDFPFFDFSDSAQFNVTEEDFFDGWHGSERVYLRIVERIAQALPDTLGTYADPATLRQIDAQARDTWRIFD